MLVCPRQRHFGCVLVGIEHDVHEREARVALDAVAWLRSLARCVSSVASVCLYRCTPVLCVVGLHCAVCVVLLREVPFTLIQVLASIFSTRRLLEIKRYVSQWSELCRIGDTDGCLCVWFALLAVWLVVYAPGTPMCVRVGFISM